jgi:hypothetical protein
MVSNDVDVVVAVDGREGALASVVPGSPLLPFQPLTVRFWGEGFERIDGDASVVFVGIGGC